MKEVINLSNDTENTYIEKQIETYGDMLFRISFVMLRNYADSEDAVQNTFLKYFSKAPWFRDEEHRKAWLITVCTNDCIDILRKRKSHHEVNLQQTKQFCREISDSGIMEALMKVDEKYRIVLMLYYIDEYKIKDIAQIIGRTPSAVKMRLQKGRKLLKEIYEREFIL